MLGSSCEGVCGVSEWGRDVGLWDLGWIGHATDEDEGDGEDDEAHDEVGHLQRGRADDKVHGDLERADGGEYDRADGDDHTPPSGVAQLELAGRVHVGVPAVAHRAVAARVSRRLGSELALARQVHGAVGAAADAVHEWRGSSALLHADEAHLYVEVDAWGHEGALRALPRRQ